MLKKLTLFILLILSGTMLELNGQGLHITNQTSYTVRMRMSTPVQEYVSDLRPRESYFYSHHPDNMTIYGPNGVCSQFYNIGMNPIFDTLLIRSRNGSPGCVVLGWTGRTRQASPRTIGPVPFEPNYCRRYCWNPTTGAMATQRSNGIITGPISTYSPIIMGAGTDNVEPNPART